MLRSTFVSLVLFVSVYAQNPYGRITGRVSDAQQGMIPGAAVRVVNVDTNVAVQASTNAEGVYDIPSLVAGQYRLEAQKDGFKRHERGPFEVRVGDVLNLAIVLDVGSMTDSVTVTAEAPLLESASASLSHVVDNRRLLDLPLPGASPNYLVQLAPGVISTTAPTHGWLPQAHDSISELASTGSRTRSAEFTLDGVPNMQSAGQINLVPPPEMIQEFRVQTAAYDASSGHFTGAVVNMALKSGTNEFHGSGAFSHVSRPLMTKPFFTNRFIYDTRTGPITKDKIDKVWLPTRTNRYRGAFGGPVYFPRLYNGHDRTFWTYGFDVLQRQPAIVGTYTVPTLKQRSGDFSELLALGSQYQVYDPATIAPAAAGRFSRQPFPGNVVPAARIDPMAQKLMGYWPNPNMAGSADGRSNYSSFGVNRIDYHSHIARIDHAFNQNHRMFGSLSQSFMTALQNVTLGNEATGTRTNMRRRVLALNDVITLRPDLNLELRYGLTRGWPRNMANSFGFDLATLGLPATLLNQINRSVTALPEIAVPGYVALGAPTGNLQVTTYHSFAGSVSHVRGSHSLRTGAEFRILAENRYGFGNVSPHYDFDAGWTKGPLDSSAAAPIGQGLASFLLGIPTGGYIDRNDSYAEMSRYVGVFLQDDWKATRKLTITMGLRYEAELPITERYNRTNRGFDFTTPSPVQAVARANYAASPISDVPVDQFRVLGGMTFAGVGDVPRALWDTDGNNFAPRVGLAYQFLPNTVLRAGYGIFFDSLGADRNAVQLQGFNQRTSLTPSIDNGLSFRATFRNPFPDGVLPAMGSSAGLTTYLGRAPGFFWPQRRNGYMQRWSLNLQREFPHRVLVEAGYIGNRGTGLAYSEEFDPVPGRYLSTLPVRDQARIDFLSQAVPNPFYGVPEFAGSNLQGRTVARSQLLTPYPHFTSITSTLSGGYSWYHALTLRAEKRFSHGYTLQAGYTWSKFMEAVDKLNGTDPHLTHAISPQDRPHHLTVSGIYELPFSTRGWLRRVVEGWSVQGMYQGQSGPPMGFGNIIFNGNLHDIVLPRAERTVERWFNTDAGFDRDSRNVLGSNLRQFPPRLTGLRADGFNTFDLSVIKNIRLHERLAFQLRAEAQDALNHAMFGSPVAAPTNTQFGQVTNTIWSEQRKISLTGKLTW